MRSGVARESESSELEGRMPAQDSALEKLPAPACGEEREIWLAPVLTWSEGRPRAGRGDLGEQSSLALGFIPCDCSASLCPGVLGIPIPKLPLTLGFLPPLSPIWAPHKPSAPAAQRAGLRTVCSDTSGWLTVRDGDSAVAGWQREGFGGWW